MRSFIETFIKEAYAVVANEFYQNVKMTIKLQVNLMVFLSL
ncbi:MAG: hypothetical protein K0Q87_3449 [Neobacillus sp.]|nr:hypothetical protein [Neobacillus sp.]